MNVCKYQASNCFPKNKATKVATDKKVPKGIFDPHFFFLKIKSGIENNAPEI